MRVQRIADVTHACRTSNSGRYGTEFLTAYEDFAQLFAMLSCFFQSWTRSKRFAQCFAELPSLAAKKLPSRKKLPWQIAHYALVAITSVCSDATNVAVVRTAPASVIIILCIRVFSF